MIVVADDESGLVVEDRAPRIRPAVEIEHAENRACDLIERSTLIDRRRNLIDLVRQDVST